MRFASANEKSSIQLVLEKVSSKEDAKELNKLISSQTAWQLIRVAKVLDDWFDFLRARVSYWFCKLFNILGQKSG
jgi:predicted site-specific integrase-resolvase